MRFVVSFPQFRQLFARFLVNPFEFYQIKNLILTSCGFLVPWLPNGSPSLSHDGDLELSQPAVSFTEDPIF